MVADGVSTGTPKVSVFVSVIGGEEMNETVAVSTPAIRLARAKPPTWRYTLLGSSRRRLAASKPVAATRHPGPDRTDDAHK